MADDGMRPIVVKRVKKVVKGGHGGAWKIAYADFVTAMMAFFLLMWLLGSTSKGDLVGISDYFKTPLRVSMMGGASTGDATSVIQGGGADLTRSPGQVARGEASPAEQRRQSAAQAREEDARLAALKGRIESVIEVNPMLKKYQNQLILDITSEGLRIQIVDEKNRPMFALASAQLQPYTKEILHIIGMVLNEVPNKIGISGHTDATPYFSDAGYSNWELSADRANASRREMVMGGLQDEKILRVVGLSSAAHLDARDPFNPINRRISIIVMNKRTEDAVRRDAAKLELPVQQPAAASAATRDALNQ